MPYKFRANSLQLLPFYKRLQNGKGLGEEPIVGMRLAPRHEPTALFSKRTRMCVTQRRAGTA